MANHAQFITKYAKFFGKSKVMVAIPDFISYAHDLSILTLMSLFCNVNVDFDIRAKPPGFINSMVVSSFC